MLTTSTIETLLGANSLRKVVESGSEFYERVRKETPDFIRAEYPGGANVTRLAADMSVSASLMSEVLSDLVRMGQLKKKQVKRNGRKAVLYIPASHA